MDLNISNETLKSALIRANEFEFSFLPNDKEIDHVFSKKFEKNMQKLILHQKQSNKDKLKTSTQICIKKRIIISIAAAIVMIMTSITVFAVRKQIIYFRSYDNIKYTRISFRSEIPITIDKNPLLQAPTFIPEGFKLTNEQSGLPYIFVYEKEREYLIYTQAKLDKTYLDINTEGVILEELQFNGLSAKYYSNKGIQNLMWYDDKYFYSVVSTQNKNIVFKIAESVTPSNKNEEKVEK